MRGGRLDVTGRGQGERWWRTIPAAGRGPRRGVAGGVAGGGAAHRARSKAGGGGRRGRAVCVRPSAHEQGKAYMARDKKPKPKLCRWTNEREEDAREV